MTDDLNAYSKKIELLENTIKQICFYANYDDLTHLMQFYLLKTRAEQQIKAPLCNNLSMILIGIDNFQEINKILGNELGDILLHRIAERIFQFNSTCSRKMSDEFVILLANSPIPNVNKHIKSILDALSQAFQIGQYTIKITASAGVSRYPQDAKTINELINNSNIALHRAKQSGINNYLLYSAKMGYRARYIKQLQQDLFFAFNKKEFFLYYQPKIEIQTKCIIGAEAVLRWRNPNFGLVDPEHFIPLLEKTEQIITVGDWVLKQACKQAKIWQQINEKFQISVNISTKQFMSHHIRDKEHIVASVKHALHQSSLSPEHLELEITEGMIMRDDTITKNNLKKLRALGIQISCDDFGVGYASFSRLKQLHLDSLKIDKSLIEGITTHHLDFVIIKSILAIARQMNIKVVAEGVRNIKEFQLLNSLGCDILQGFFFSKPVSPDAINKLLKRNKLLK